VSAHELERLLHDYQKEEVVLDLPRRG